jgi:hypothetical protein
MNRNAKIIFYCLLVSISLFSCSKKIPTSSIADGPAFLRLTTLKADNISEEVSGEDEIHLMCWLVKDSTPTPIVLREWQDSLVFYKNKIEVYQTLAIQDSIHSFYKTKLIILVMEVDTELPFKERAAIVRRCMEENNYEVNDSLKTKIASKILDDDLLSLSFQNISSLAKNESGQILFSGNHLFDNYYYRIAYSLYRKQ